MQQQNQTTQRNYLLIYLQRYQATHKAESFNLKTSLQDFFLEEN